MKENIYQRLPGRGVSLFSYYTLFLGKESLMQVVSTFAFREQYQRFAYSDIQAITIRKTRRASLLNTLLVALIALALTLGASFGSLSGTGPAWLVTCGSLALFFSIPLLISLRNGPICTCHLQTAIQSVPLRSLGRLRHINQALDELQPRISQSQGTLSPDELSQLLQTTTTTTTDPTPSAHPPITDPNPAPGPDTPPPGPSPS